MKVSRGFSLELADFQIIEDYAKAESITENEAVARLVRFGRIHLMREEQQMSRLAPDNSDLR